MGLYDPAEVDLELFCDSWSAGFLGERLYAARPRTFVTVNIACELVLDSKYWSN